jgi:outer membrane protein OmpA-like peptidoglycan-associated protein
LLASAQGLELSGGYAHITGDNGLDGLHVGVAGWFTPRISLAFDYDSAWDTSHLGVFELTQTGVIVTKSHLQDFLGGPRISFPGALRNKVTFLPRLWPFAEVQLGVSSLHSSLVNETTNISESGSDRAFSWMVGGGADYRLSPHWVGRVKLDYLRTHFSDTGQGRLRFTFGVAYTFGERGAKEAAEAKRQAEADLAAAEAKRKAICEECKNHAAATEQNQAAPTEQKSAAATEQFDSEKQALRARLLEQFNRVLPTTDTPRGLVVDMADVLFDSGQSALRPEAREDLAKLSGIVLNYPSLLLRIEGHTDNSGSAETNQALSQQRANNVRDYLVRQGLDAGSLSAQGLGENNPVADNGTDEGRQKNRRIEIIVSGQVIGTQIGH